MGDRIRRMDAIASLVNSFNIRLAQINDANTLLEIRKEAILALTEIVADVSQVEQWANSAGPDRTKTAIAKHIVWVAEYQNNLVGWVEVNAETIKALYVRPTAWRSGIGSALLSQAEEWIDLHGFPFALLNASLTAEAFYLHRGYTSAKPLADRSIPMNKQLSLDKPS